MRLSSISVRGLIIRVVLLGIFDVFAVYLAVAMGTQLNPIIGILIGLFTIFANVVFLDDRLTSWRWIAPALAGMVLLVVYPIGYSLAIAFTNNGDGHSLPKQVAIDQITGSSFFSAPDAPTYKASVYRSPAGTFRFWLKAPDGKFYIATQGQSGLTPVDPNDPKYATKNAKGVPDQLDEYTYVTNLTEVSRTLQGYIIDAPPSKIYLTKLNLLAGDYDAKPQQPQYSYDAARDVIIDNKDGTVYRAERGTFIAGEGDNAKRLNPGYTEFVGLDNLSRVVTDATVRDPFFRVFAWTIIFAGASVITTFALGLAFALVLNDKNLPFRPIWRSLLIIPYALPGYLVAVTWKGLLNPNYGPVNNMLLKLFGVSPNWWADPTLAKIGILLVNLYLGFPYMMLITLGALQSIPADMYEAAMIDGADGRQKLQFITLPMLLLAVGPLLVASFSYNFNNFTLIELVNQGGPPISASTVAGHTDILISYTYRLAFGGAQGADYGFASAISIFIFLIVGTITFVNFRFTRQLEEVSENV